MFKFKKYNIIKKSEIINDNGFIINNNICRNSIMIKQYDQYNRCVSKNVSYVINNNILKVDEFPAYPGDYLKIFYDENQVEIFDIKSMNDVLTYLENREIIEDYIENKYGSSIDGKITINKIDDYTIQCSASLYDYDDGGSDYYSINNRIITFSMIEEFLFDWKRKNIWYNCFK